MTGSTNAQTSNTSTRLWFYYIITKIRPPFQNPGSAPVHVLGIAGGLLGAHLRAFSLQEKTVLINRDL